MAIWLNLFLIGSLLMMSIYHFGIFIQRPQDHSTLFFSLVCLLGSTRIIFTGERLFYVLFPDFHYTLGIRIEVLSTYLAAPIFALFLQSIYPSEFNKFFINTTISFFGFLAFLAATTPLVFYSKTVPFFSLALIFEFIYITYAMALAAYRNKIGAKIGLIAIAILFAALVNDQLYANLIINTTYVSELGFFVYLFSQSFLLSLRFSRSFDQVELLSAELEHKNRKLLELDKIKDEFLANTSHELRTPLHGIIGITDSLLNGAKGEIPDTIKHQLTLVTISARRLSGLVNDILDFSKLKHHDIQLNHKAVDLFQLVAIELEIHSIVSDNKDINYFNDIAIDFPLLLGDEDRVTRIIQNLIDNAVKFTDKGEIRVSSVLLPSGYAAISVYDTGIGIPSEKMHKIFKPFEQVANIRLQKPGGTGLGLPISRSLVELHGGVIWGESLQDQGTCFTFTLPIYTGKLETNDESHANTIQLYKSKPKIDTLGINNKEITPISSNSVVLVVDDEPINLEIMKNYLALENCTPITANNGKMVIALLSKIPKPDCVVLDIMMPGISGLDLAREIRKSFSTAELPILIVTAKPGPADLIASVNSGANDFLTKPFEREEFILRIKNMLSLSQSHKKSQTQITEKREAIKKEREQINANLHDHLGAQLTDLKLMSEEAIKDPLISSEFAEKLNQTTLQTISLLRAQMLHLEDLDLLTENFLEGINLILLRRYSDAGREFNFHSTKELETKLMNTFDDSTISSLYAITKEITTNDLKYGQGVANWSFIQHYNMFRIIIKNKTNFHLEKRSLGHGTENIIRRLSSINGKIQMSLINDEITIELEIPFIEKI